MTDWWWNELLAWQGWEVMARGVDKMSTWWGKGKKSSNKFPLPWLPHIFNFVKEKEENLWNQFFFFFPVWSQRCLCGLSNKGWTHKRILMCHFYWAKKHYRTGDFKGTWLFHYSLQGQCLITENRLLCSSFLWCLALSWIHMLWLGKNQSVKI